jgi:hypothetical protein
MSEIRFSRWTVIAAIEVMEAAGWSHAELTRQLLKLSQELASKCDAGSLKDRFNHLIKFVDAHPELRCDDDGLLGDVLVEKAILLLPPSKPEYPWQQPRELSGAQQAFIRSLDLDGFMIAEGALRRTLPAELELPQAEDEVTRLLKKHGFMTPKGHLDQALAAHGRGEWASANGQLRTFFEGLLDEVAIKIDPSAATLPTSENRRARLASQGFLVESLNEWSGDGKNFINGLWKRLHPSGSHPGLSDQDDSTFRRHIVLLTAKLLLVRFDSWPP